MKSFNRMLLACVSALILALVATYSVLSPIAVAQGKGFRWPLYDNAGNLKYQILGSSATQGAGGKMIVNDMIIEIFGSDKKIETKILADKCTYDEASKLVVAEGKVRMEREGIIITGIGLIWSEKSGEVRILDDSRVEITNGNLLKGKEGET